MPVIHEYDDLLKFLGRRVIFWDITPYNPLKVSVSEENVTSVFMADEA
jgi:hypothetical protein